MSILRRFSFRRRTPIRYLLFLPIALVAVAPVCAQQKSKKSSAAPLSSAPPALTRTTTKHEVRRFGYGGTLTVLGAPAGSITIEAWNRNEADITADIELRADTEEDLARLATVNGVVLDEDANHLRIISTGTHDRAFMRRVAKDFPKRLLGLPWKIDYRIHVPASTDLEISAGHGPINISNIESGISLTALESDAQLTLTGGTVMVTIGSGSVKLNVGARSWRGAGANIRLAAGDLTVQLPAGFNADIDAEVLRTGRIENSYPTLEPRERTTTTERSIKGRAGAGGPVLALTVGDGTLRIKPAAKEQ